MRGLYELVFSVTNQCTARCQDCPIVHEGDPARQLTPENMMPIVDEVESWGSLLLVVFTGGEPLLLGDDLLKMVGYVAEKGILSRIVTNAYWATSKAKALQVLGELKARGLSEINYSCDDYHQEFIPLENIRHANEAACEIGLPALLGHRKKPGGLITVDYLSEYLGVKLDVFKPESKNPKNNVITSSPNVPLDCGLDQQQALEWEINENQSAWVGACDTVLKSIIVSSDLRVQICCGIATNSISELSIGSLQEEDLLSILQRGNRDLITNWLALEGPSSILEFVRSKDPTIELPEAYVNRCHLCNVLFTHPRVRRILQEHASEHGPALALMRGTLDWISDDWAPTTRKEEVNMN